MDLDAGVVDVELVGVADVKLAGVANVELAGIVKVYWSKLGVNVSMYFCPSKVIITILYVTSCVKWKFTLPSSFVQPSKLGFSLLIYGSFFF
jgi:hypothetical protein